MVQETEIYRVLIISVKFCDVTLYYSLIQVDQVSWYLSQNAKYKLIYIRDISEIYCIFERKIYVLFIYICSYLTCKKLLPVLFKILPNLIDYLNAYRRSHYKVPQNKKQKLIKSQYVEDDQFILMSAKLQPYKLLFIYIIENVALFFQW